MKKIKLDDLKFYSLLMVVITIPLPMSINNFAIFLFVILCLTDIVKHKRFFKPSQVHIYFMIFFVAGVVSIFNSCDSYEGVKVIEKYLSFIIFPLLINFVRLDKSKLHKLRNGFLGIVTLLFFIAIIIAVYNSIVSGSVTIFNQENLVIENRFKYHRLMGNVEMSATVFATYLVFCIAIIVDNVFINKSFKKYSLLFIILILGAIYLMNSFTAYFALGVVLFSISFYLKIDKKYYSWLLLPMILSVFLFHIKAKGLDTEILNYNLNDDIHNRNWNSLNVRLAKWECSFEIIKENFPFGTGVGCAQTSLNSKYKEMGFEVGYIKKFSSHNQYIHTLLEAGLLGLLSYLILLVIGIYVSLKNGNFLLHSLISILIITGLTDNFLIVNKGIVFFAVFISVLSYRTYDNQKTMSSEIKEN